jgi:hypothetical protein
VAQIGKAGRDRRGRHSEAWGGARGPGQGKAGLSKACVAGARA